MGEAKNSAMPVLSCRGVVKRFGGVLAVNKVDFDLNPGEVLALVGDNGAGKSTLIQVVSGVYRCDDGEIYLEGERQDFTTPEDARRAGIETIYQDLALCDNLTAANNIFLGREIPKRRFGFFPGINEAEMREKARDVLDELHIRISEPGAPVSKLSGGQRQAVAISRAVFWQARVMIMDEPTAALGVPEQRKVIDLIRTLKARGTPVILISHNMQDVFEISDRICVMRRGQNVGEFVTAKTDSKEIVRTMIGG